MKCFYTVSSPVTPGVVCRPSCGLCPALLAVIINISIPYLGAYVYHVLGLCLLGKEMMAHKLYFHILDFSEQPAGGPSYYTRRLP